MRLSLSLKALLVAACITLAAGCSSFLRIGGEISGKITEEKTGDAIEGATVKIDLVADTSAKGGATSFSGETKTDKTGKYTFQDIGEGTYKISVSKEGYTDTSVIMKTGGAGGTACSSKMLYVFAVVNIKILLVHEGTITGTVRDSSNNLPVSGVKITVEGSSISATTDDKGGYTLKDVPAGTANVTASKQGYNNSTKPVNVIVLATATCDLYMSQTALAQLGILFVTDQDGNFEIYAMNPDGSNQVRLTNDPLFADLYPAWSKDRTKIAYVSDSGGYRAIFMMNANGSGKEQLTNTGYTTIDEKPSWSPDGSKIVFHSNRDGALNFDIYVINASAGSSPARLTTDSAHDRGPCWSPDGTKIVFSSERGNGDANIYIMNTDGSSQLQLTSDTNVEYQPSWSPDGKQIVYTSFVSATNTEIFAMGVDGTNKTNITGNEAGDIQPSWSPDGGKIVFASYRQGITPELFVINVDGSSVTRLTSNSLTDYQPCWFK